MSSIDYWSISAVLFLKKKLDKTKMGGSFCEMAHSLAYDHKHTMKILFSKTRYAQELKYRQFFLSSVTQNKWPIPVI